MGKHPGGRPTIYEDSEKGFEQFRSDTVDYIDRIEEKKQPFTVSGWADFLHITRTTIYNYKNLRNETWRNYIVSMMERTDDE